MKSVIFLAGLFLFTAACTTKKIETAAATADSVAIDSAIANTPAPALLAFGTVEGYRAKKSLLLPDSTNYFHLVSAEDLDQRFTRDKNDPATAPDFIINYVVALACAPDRRATTIAVDKVITNENSIDVYLTVVRGEAGKSATAAVHLFVIERREGYPVMQFYVNGKKDKAMVLVGS